MKNTKIKNLKQVVPTEIRIQVYRKAIKLIDKQEKEHVLFGVYALCVLLPCVLWDLKSYADYAPDKKCWSMNDTSTAFPELTDEVIRIIESKDGQTRRNVTRVAFLRQFIQELKLQIK